MANNVVNWDNVWDSFEEWISEPNPKPTCDSCGNTESSWDNRDWEEQQEKIQELVEKQLSNK